VHLHLSQPLPIRLRQWGISLIVGFGNKNFVAYKYASNGCIYPDLCLYRVCVSGVAIT